MNGDARMRERSGAVDDDRLLVVFLYVLARGHLTTGAIEGIMQDLEKADPGTTHQFTNGWLAQWARDLAERLVGQEGDTFRRLAELEAALSYAADLAMRVGDGSSEHSGFATTVYGILRRSSHPWALRVLVEQGVRAGCNWNEANPRSLDAAQVSAVVDGIIAHAGKTS